MIISDHRPGVYAKNLPSFIIAHQLHIPHSMGYISKWATSTQSSLLSHFDECWIPDTNDHRLSGTLSQARLTIPKRFIGPMSHLPTAYNLEVRYDILVMLSGPEPRRSLLEDRLLSLLYERDDLKVALIRGTDQPITTPVSHGHIEIYNLVTSSHLSEIIAMSEILICRSGYSTIMDLTTLEQKAIFIPTSGQPEQEYLAKLHSTKDRYESIMARDISTQRLNEAINRLRSI